MTYEGFHGNNVIIEYVSMTIKSLKTVS